MNDVTYTNWKNEIEFQDLFEVLKTGEWKLFDGYFYRKPLNNELTKWQANDGGVVHVSGIIELIDDYWEPWMIDELDGVYDLVKFLKDMGWLVSCF